MSGSAEQKAELRRRMKELRAACTDRAARDARIQERLFALPQVAEGRVIFIYRSFSHEADTRAAADRLLAEGRTVLLPRTDGKEMNAVQWAGQALRKGAYGIEEPEGEPYRGAADVCVLPLLAADPAFYRLGYGGGYYDRFLSGRNIYKIGICYDFQIVGRVPCEPHDVRLDAIVTDSRTLIRR